MKRRIISLAAIAAAVSAVILLGWHTGRLLPAGQVFAVTPGQFVNETFTYDLVVYGGTPSGIMAAVAASGEGLKVAVINPGTHVGGIVTSGLCFSDIGKPGAVGGLAKTFFEMMGAYYGESSPVYAFEPHAAERVFNAMLDNAGVDVFTGRRLKEKGGVQKDGARILSVTTEDGSVFSGAVFIDSSYEGDLMAGAGVSYAVGREGAAQYRESLAGVRPFYRFNNFIFDTPARTLSGRLMAAISTETLPEVGRGDRNIQAYNFRLCLTQEPSNMVPFQKPARYDPAQYEVLLKWLFVLKHAQGDRDLKITDILSLGPLRNGKFDANNGGPVSSDAIGLNQGFPDAGYSGRTEIALRHKDYLQGLLYFASTDSRVPAELRTDMASWGLAKDEFTNNGHWPYELYVRECRRLTGDFVLTQRDLTADTVKNDVITVGSYNIDSHNIRRVMTKGGLVQNEGEIQTPVQPYMIPYRCIVPKAAEASNLLVTVCISASHVAYSSVRIEPQFMMLGHAAGVAAGLAIRHNIAVQEIDIPALQVLLKAQGAVLSD